VVEGDGTDVWGAVAFLAALFLAALFLGALFFEAFWAVVFGSAAATTDACVGFAAFLAALLTFAQRIFIAAAILARPAAEILRRV
jgi:small basic protein